MPESLPSYWIEIVTAAIDPQRLIDHVATSQAGASILFLGTVRELTQGRQTLWLDYDAYPEMALKQMRELVDEAAARWPVLKVAVLHRLGRLELKEASVAVAVSSPHRDTAFSAARFLIDELKVRVPIWKKEHWADGTTEWVHPGADE